MVSFVMPWSYIKQRVISIWSALPLLLFTVYFASCTLYQGNLAKYLNKTKQSNCVCGCGVSPHLCLLTSAFFWSLVSDLHPLITCFHNHELDLTFDQCKPCFSPSKFSVIRLAVCHDAWRPLGNSWAICSPLQEQGEHLGVLPKYIFQHLP